MQPPIPYRAFKARRLLVAVALAGALAASGCAGGGGPDDEAYPGADDCAVDDPAGECYESPFPDTSNDPADSI